MALWLIPAKIVVFTEVRIEAETRTEAIKKFYARDWVEQSDNDTRRTIVTKQGAVKRDD